MENEGKKVFNGETVEDIASEKEPAKEQVDELASRASAGDPQALYELAKREFDRDAPENWDAAYDYLTRDNALPIGDDMQTAVRDILNHGKYNHRVVRMGIAFCIISAAVFAVGNMRGVFMPGTFRIVLGIVLLVCEVLALAWGMLKHRRDNYSSIWRMLPIQLLLWFVMMLVCLA